VAAATSCEALEAGGVGELASGEGETSLGNGVCVGPVVEEVGVGVGSETGPVVLVGEEGVCAGPVVVLVGDGEGLCAGPVVLVGDGEELGEGPVVVLVGDGEGLCAGLVVVVGVGEDKGDGEATEQVKGRPQTFTQVSTPPDWHHWQAAVALAFLAVQRSQVVKRVSKQGLNKERSA